MAILSKFLLLSPSPILTSRMEEYPLSIKAQNIKINPSGRPVYVSPNGRARIPLPRADCTSANTAPSLPISLDESGSLSCSSWYVLHRTSCLIEIRMLWLRNNYFFLEESLLREVLLSLIPMVESYREGVSWLSTSWTYELVFFPGEVCSGYILLLIASFTK